MKSGHPAAGSSVRLTPRDKDLLVHVAAARLLTTAQLKRLVFAAPASLRRQALDGKVKPPSDQVCRRRLGLLSSPSGGLAYLRRLHYRDDHGAPVAVYAVTAHGWSIARQLLRRAPPLPGDNTQPQFLAHEIALNELYVALAIAAAKLRRAPAQFPFVWIATESAGLPWQERNTKTGHVEGRRLLPDAILELSTERTRVFLECEMGGHPIERRDAEALGSVLSKLRRYSSFMAEGGQLKFYAQKYADGWKAELVFLVHSGERAANIERAVETWRSQNRAVPLVVRALSFDKMAAHFCGRLGLQGPPEPEIPITATEARLAFSFVVEVASTYKSVRHFLRANPAVRAQGCCYPEYTPEFERMVALVERWRGQLGVAQGGGLRG